jgi:hypothetical protein
LGVARQAEQTADAVVVANRASRARGELSGAAAKKLDALNHKFWADKKKLEARVEGRAGALRAQLAALEAAAAASHGLARDLKEQQVDALAAQLDAVPEVAALAALSEAHEDAVAALTEAEEDEGGGGDENRAVSHSSAEYKKARRPSLFEFLCVNCARVCESDAKPSLPRTDIRP